jgi:predicted RNA polymerase sigma factor
VAVPADEGASLEVVQAQAGFEFAVAALRWLADGVPDEPRSWLIRVAPGRMIDHLRSDRARRDREAAAGMYAPVNQFVAPGPGVGDADQDDSLVLLFLCCHPALTATAQAALTLRAVGGLTTAEIARAYLVPEPRMAQRIARAKQRIKPQGYRSGFRRRRSARRVDVVLQVLYLIFNEGYLSTSGPGAQRVELSAEAIVLIGLRGDRRERNRMVVADTAGLWLVLRPQLRQLRLVRASGWCGLSCCPNCV